MKTLLKIVVALVLLFVVVVVGLILSRNLIATSVARAAANAMFSVPVKIESVELSFSPLGAVTRGIEVDNPTGYKEPKAITAGKIDVQLSPTTTPQKVVLDLVELDTVGIWFIADGTTNNISQIIAGMSKTESGAPSTAPTVEVLIKRLVLNNVDVHATESSGLTGAIPIAAKIDHLELTDISTKSNGAGLMEQVSGNVFQATMSAVVGQIGGKLPGDIVKGVSGSLDQAGAVAGKAVEAISDMTKGAGAAATDAVKGAGDALKGLGDALGGKK